jgi:hypothetical protein
VVVVVVVVVVAVAVVVVVVVVVNFRKIEVIFTSKTNVLRYQY